MLETLFVKDLGNGVFDARDDFKTFMEGDVVGIYRLGKEMIVTVILEDVVEEVK